MAVEKKHNGPVVVMAYQAVGCVCLRALLDAGADIAAVFTHEDDPGEEVWFGSVMELAASAGLPVYTPEKPNDIKVIEKVREIGPDFIFSFYYRLMLSEAFLAEARVGAYNLHGSLLPKYRGKAPVNWVLVNGELETGVTLHRMVKRPDAGPIVGSVAVPIKESDNIRDLYAKIVPAAGRLIAEAWPKLRDGLAVETPQDESRASYYGGRKPADGLIDWLRPSKTIYDLVRAVTHPYPGAFTYFGGRKLFIWEASYEPSVSMMEDWRQKPGTVIGYDDDAGLAVATGQGRLYIKSANWENQTDGTGSGLTGLGIHAGENFDVSGR